MARRRLLLLGVWLWLGVGLVGTWALVERPEHGRTRLALIALLSIWGLGLYLCSQAGRPREAEPDPVDRRSLLAAAALWVAVLPVCIWLRQRGTRVELEWTMAPYLDKRWLVILYWMTVLVVLWFPFVIGWLLRLKKADSHTTAPETAPRFRSKHAGLLFLALLLSTAAFGPPWNVEWSERMVNPHETVHLGGLQAIESGLLPYVGPSSTNYGPGAQVATYSYMSLSDQFSIIGFREFYALSLWGAVFLYCAMVLLALPGPVAAVAILAVFIVSPVAGWRWTGEGVLDGLFGWASLLRNTATFVLSLGIYWLVCRPQRTVAVLVGVVWGGFAYFAQENFLGGIVLVGILLGLAVAGDLLGFRGGLRALAYLGLGFALVWIPFLSVYAWNGELAALLHNYFLVPGQFLRGFANTPYKGTLNRDPLAVAFHVTPVLAVLVGAAAVYRLRPLRLARPLTPRRFLVVSVALAYLAAFPSALLRSDAAHFQSTTFAVPVLMALGIVELQRMSKTTTALGRFLVAGLATLVCALAYLPAWAGAPARMQQLARGRWQSFSLTAKTLPYPVPDSEPGRGYGPSEAQSRRATVELMERLAQRVGGETVLVLVDVPPKQKPSHEYVYDGLVYFLADLVPGPILMERSAMVADSDDLARFMSHLEAHIDELEWIVSLAATSPEIEIFKAANPGWTMETLEHPGTRLYLFGRSPDDAETER